MQYRHLKRVKHLETLGSGKRVYMMQGNGRFGQRIKKLSKRLGGIIRNLAGQAYKRGKPIVKQTLKEIAPVLATAAANKVGEEAAKRGASDFVVNTITKAGQQGAKKLEEQSKSGRKKLSSTDQKAADFLNSQAQSVLARILAGNGINTLGGRGINTLGGGLVEQQAPNLQR